jgi:hypothetical protein
MPDPSDHLETVGDLAARLQALGLTPILVGGMALVVLGSRRVTRDFDFLMSAPGDHLAEVVRLLYERHLALVSRLTPEGDVAATIANRRVALSRLQIDRPANAAFFDTRTGLRVDLLFDFPVAAAPVSRRAVRVRIGRHVLHVASEEDLLELKKNAAANRQAAGDAEDIAFLERRRRR